LSGPIGADYSLRAEDEDLAALLKQTGARNVFGVRDGALFALLGALWVPSIEKVAGYEPLLFLDQPGLDNFLCFMRQFDQQLAEAGWAMPSSPRSRAQVRQNHGPGFRGSADAVPELRDASRGNAGQGRRRAAGRSLPPPSITRSSW
jgi:hypothetical protein